MRSIAATVTLVAAMAGPLGAQGRGGFGQDRIPPGYMPPAGACRVWYDGLPPGQQPPPMSCRDAERLASRTRQSRVVYGPDTREPIGHVTAIETTAAAQRDPRDSRYESRYPERVSSAPYENGYRDGYEKGREDARDRDSFDPVRHRRYRSADHGYERRYGSRDDYKLIYRDGFEAGYRDGYGEHRLAEPDRERSLSRWLPWPFD